MPGICWRVALFTHWTMVHSARPGRTEPVRCGVRGRSAGFLKKMTRLSHDNKVDKAVGVSENHGCLTLTN